MKKTVVALAFVLAGGLVAACGGGESETPEAPTTAPARESAADSISGCPAISHG